MDSGSRLTKFKSHLQQVMGSLGGPLYRSREQSQYLYQEADIYIYHINLHKVLKPSLEHNENMNTIILNSYY